MKSANCLQCTLAPCVRAIYARPMFRKRYSRPGSAPATLSLRRFGDAGMRVGTLPAHGRAGLTVPRDSARAPWRLTIATAAPLRVCTARR